MTDRIASLAQNAADKSTAANASGQTPAGSFAARVRGHKASIGMGVVGLVIGAIAANPLLAIAGLVGGIAAGTVFLDSRKQGANSVAHDSTRHSGPCQLGDPDAVQPAAAADFSRTLCHPPAPGHIALDAAFDACDPDSPKPSGNTPASRRQLF
jgi:hypothetical protein